MKRFTKQARVLAASLVVVVAGMVGVAAAANSTAPASNAMQKGMGINEYGMTKSFFNGGTVSFTYSKGYYCDKSVSSAASSGCEAGAEYKVPPAKSFDPLYITVPLGFTVPSMSMECPSALVCEVNGCTAHGGIEELRDPRSRALHNDPERWSS
jgi:hypothetical protein